MLVGGMVICLGSVAPNQLLTSTRGFLPVTPKPPLLGPRFVSHRSCEVWTCFAAWRSLLEADALRTKSDMRSEGVCLMEGFGGRLPLQIAELDWGSPKPGCIAAANVALEKDSGPVWKTTWMEKKPIIRRVRFVPMSGCGKW